MGLALILVAITKLLAPSAFGLWANQSGSIAMLGLFPQNPPGFGEVLGWWIVPIACALAVAAFCLTRRLLAVLKPML
jgi:hypothetical protein